MGLLRTSRYSWATRFVAAFLASAQIGVGVLNSASVALAAEQAPTPVATAAPAATPSPEITLADFGCAIDQTKAGTQDLIVSARDMFGGVGATYSFTHLKLSLVTDQSARAEIFRAEVTSADAATYSADALKRSAWVSLGLAQSGYQGLITTDTESNGTFFDGTAEAGKQYLYLFRADTTMQPTDASCAVSGTVTYAGTSTENFSAVVDKVATGGRSAVEEERNLAVEFFGDTQCGNVLKVVARPWLMIAGLVCGLVVTVRAFSIYFLYQSMAFLATASGIKFTSDIDVSDFILSAIIPQEFIGIDLQNKLVGINSDGVANGAGATMGSVVITGHSFLLNIVNTLLVLGFILIALANILQIQVKTYELKKMLPTLVVGFIVANFSLFIIRAGLEIVTIVGQGLFEVNGASIISTSQQSLATTAPAAQRTNGRSQTVFIPPNISDPKTTGYTAPGCAPNAPADLWCFVRAVSSVGGNPEARLTVPKSFQAPSGWAALNPWAWSGAAVDSLEEPDWTAIIMQAILNLLVLFNAVIFFCLGAVFIIRTIVIYFLAPLSPIGFMGMVVPQLKAIGDPFKKNLANWLFMPLNTFFWIWLAFMWVRTSWTIPGFNAVFLDTDKAATGGAVYFNLPTIPGIITYIFMMICMMRALKTPDSMAGELKGLVGKITAKPGKLWEATGGKQIERAKKFTSGAAKFATGFGLDKAEGLLKMAGANKAVKSKQGTFTALATTDYNKAKVAHNKGVNVEAMKIKREAHANGNFITAQEALAQAKQKIGPMQSQADFVKGRVTAYSEEEKKNYLRDESKQNAVGWLRGLGKRTDTLIQKMENSNKASEQKLESQINVRLAMSSNRLPGGLLYRHASDRAKEDALIASSADAATKSKIEEDFATGGPLPGLAMINKQQRREVGIRKSAMENKAKATESKEAYEAAFVYAARQYSMGKNMDNITDPVEKEMLKQAGKNIKAEFGEEVKKVNLSDMGKRSFDPKHDDKLWKALLAGGAWNADASAFATDDAERKEINTAAHQYGRVHSGITSAGNVDNHEVLAAYVNQLNSWLSQSTNPELRSQMADVMKAFKDVQTAHTVFTTNRDDTSKKNYSAKISAFNAVYNKKIGDKLELLSENRGKYAV